MRFLSDMSFIQMSLNALLQKYQTDDKREIYWAKIIKSAFKTSKEKLSQATIIYHPYPTATLLPHI